MALLICPDCGHKVSSRAAACPECGCPVKYMTEPFPSAEPAQPARAVPPAEPAQPVQAVPPAEPVQPSRAVQAFSYTLKNPSTAEMGAIALIRRALKDRLECQIRARYIEGWQRSLSEARVQRERYADQLKKASFMRPVNNYTKLMYEMYERSIRNLEEKCAGCRSVQDAAELLRRKEQEISRYHEDLEILEARSREGRERLFLLDPENARKAFADPSVSRDLSRDKVYWALAASDARFLQALHADRRILENVHSSCIPDNLRRILEETDYDVPPRDEVSWNRDQLEDYAAWAFQNASGYFRDYTILRHPSLRSLGLKVSEGMEKAHRADFAFVKNGRPKLILELCPEKKFAYFTSRMARDGVKYLHLWPDKPNTAHYVVRRVLEELEEL